MSVRPHYGRRGSLCGGPPSRRSIEGHIEAATKRRDKLSQRYFLSAALGRSYWYHGYAMTNVEEFYGVWNGTGSQPVLDSLAGGTVVGTSPVFMPMGLKDWTGDIKLDESSKLAWTAILGTGLAGGDKVYRLRKGVQKYLITDVNDPASSTRAEGQIPVMFDTFGAFRRRMQRPAGWCITTCRGAATCCIWMATWSSSGIGRDSDSIRCGERLRPYPPGGTLRTPIAPGKSVYENLHSFRRPWVVSLP